jgi:electron transport complex protein RnfG
VNDSPKSLTVVILAFGALGLAAALLLAGIDALTADRIESERREHALRAVSAMIEEGRYDNDLLDSARPIEIAGLEDSMLYTARRDGRASAIVLDVTTGEGYSGDIRLLIALDTSGEVLGVRVLEHRETPGLGDRIERDRSDWLEQFDGRSLGDPPLGDWKPDRRDGAFDTVTSATITSSAVIGAIRRVLEAFESNRRDFLTEPRVADGSD